MSAPAASHEHLPHRGAMRLIDGVLDVDEARIRCHARIRADNPLLVDGRLPAHAGVELLAQAGGLLLGARAAGGTAPTAGAIVQIKSFRVHGPDLPVGAVVEVEARFEGGTGQAALFGGEVRLDGNTILEGSLMIAQLGDTP